jgi:hypothetical protein
MIDGGGQAAVTSADQGIHRSPRQRFGPPLGQSFQAAWWPWLISRAIVLGTLALAKYELKTFHITKVKSVDAAHWGLLSSDAGWYEQIATHGYGVSGHSSIRFFPLLPIAGRFLHYVIPTTPGVAVLLITNASALLATMGLYLLVRHEMGDDVVARRSCWLLCLAPPAFVLVMGYAEALFLVLAIACFYSLRRGWWWWAAGLGYLAGLTRPLGFLLAVAAIIEVVRHTEGATGKEWLRRGVAVVAPIAGLVTYLSWTDSEFHDFWGPLTIQLSSAHHGAFTDPLATLGHAAMDLVHRQHIDTGLHVVWVLVALVLLIQTFRVLPASYGLFSAAVLLAAVSGHNLDSFERYALSAFPLVIAGGSLIKSNRVAVPVYVVLTAGLVGYGLLAFLGVYVP